MKDAWGHELFQSDHDLDIVYDLNKAAGLLELEAHARAFAKAAGKDEKELGKIYYTIYGEPCSDIPLVRGYLESGMLAKLIATAESNMLAMPTKEIQENAFCHEDPCYVYVLLGACAMSLGCTLPVSFSKMLKKVYTEGGLMPGAVKQMKRALFGPQGYEDGQPYEFKCVAQIRDEVMFIHSETREPGRMSVCGMNVKSPGVGSGMRDSTTSPVVKELRDKHHKPNVCGGCGADSAKGGKDLLRCAACKDRKYCSHDCQKKHWKVHKKLCEPAAILD